MSNYYYIEPAGLYIDLDSCPLIEILEDEGIPLIRFHIKLIEEVIVREVYCEKGGNLHLEMSEYLEKLSYIENCLTDEMVEECDQLALREQKVEKIKEDEYDLLVEEIKEDEGLDSEGLGDK